MCISFWSRMQFCVMFFGPTEDCGTLSGHVLVNLADFSVLLPFSRLRPFSPCCFLNASCICCAGRFCTAHVLPSARCRYVYYSFFIIGRGVVHDQYQADVFGQSFAMDAISMRMHAPFAAQHQEVQLGMGMHALFAAQHQQVQLDMRMYCSFRSPAPAGRCCTKRDCVAKHFFLGMALHGDQACWCG